MARGLVGARSALLRVVAVAMLGAAAAFVTPAQAATTLEAAVPATMPPSTTDLMVSLRHQNHLWQTYDGAIHLLVNRGTSSFAKVQGALLELWSSFDGGSTWNYQLSLPNSDFSATPDSQLVGNDLTVIYPASETGGTIYYVVAHYSGSGVTRWSLTKSETAFTSTTLHAYNPAFATDRIGRLWCAFVTKDTATALYSIKMLVRDSYKGTWADTGLTFGPVDDGGTNYSTNGGRSARPVSLKNGVGLLFSVEGTLYWATRPNGLALKGGWTQLATPLVTNSSTDPYSSHFSVQADANGSLHLATVLNSSLVYFRYVAQNQAWTAGPKQLLTASSSVAYPSVTIASSNIMVSSNDLANGAVFQSSDGGRTFVQTHALAHDAITANLVSTPDFSHPRMLAPALSLGPVPVLQQYVLLPTPASPTQTPIDKLMLFSVPIVQP